MRVRPTQLWSRRTAAAVLAVAATTGVSACSSSQSADSMSTPSASVTASPSVSATARGQHLEASDFADAIKTPGTIVIDVRTPAEYASGHLPEARNIDLGNPGFAKQIDALDKKSTYAVYCHSGKRSGVALEQMAIAGFTHVYDLSGGITAWKEMGGAVVTPGS